MKKYIQNIWVRLLACLMCTVSILGVALGAVGSLFFIENPEEERFLKEGNQQIMLNYALYATENLLVLPEFLQDTNLYMTVERMEYQYKESKEPESTVLFSNMPEGGKIDYVVEEIYPSICVISIRSKESV